MTSRSKLALIGAAALGLAGAVAWAMIPAERFAYGVAPIGEGEAVLLTRRNESDGTWFWVQLVRRDGTVVWDASTEGLRTEESLGFTAVAAGEARIALLGERNGGAAVMGLDRASGERRWETKVGDDASTFIGEALVVDGPRVVAIVEHGGRVGITALALADGSVQWSFDASEHFPGGQIRRAMAIAPDRVAVVPRGDAGVVLDGTSGEVLGRLAAERLACEIPKALVGFSGSKVIRMARPPADVVDVVPLDVRPDLDAPCGERGDDVVVGATNDRGEAFLVRVDPALGSVLWTLPLGSHSFQHAESRDGRLPRYLPVSLEGDERAIAVVDLDAGALVSEHPHDDFRMAFVTGERAFVVDFLDLAFFVLDPERGTLERVVGFRGGTGSEIRVQDFRHGELWVHGMGWGRPGDLDWAVLDLRTGTVTATNGELVATDLGAEGWRGR